MLAEGGDINIICAGDGISDAFTPVLTGANGETSGWIITSASGYILARPAGPPFDLEGAGGGACFLYHISYDASFTGAISTGDNICELTEEDGCFDLSNHITINRQTGDNCNAACTALSSGIALTDGSTSTSICVDEVGDPLDIVMSGEFDGDNTTFIITAADGEILAIPPGVGPFDLNGAGPGTCVIWYLAYDDGLTGLSVGQNTDDFVGCFDLSNGVIVKRNEAEAGSISLSDGSTSASICADGTPDPLTVVMSGDVAGDNSTFFITDAATGEILAIPGNNGPFDLDGAGEGVCDIWYLSAYDNVMGLATGNNIDDLAGCFDLSNAITVTRNVGNDCDGAVDGGAISLATGGTEATICVDGIADPLEVTRDGNAVGDNRTFIITDAVTGEILAIPGSNGPFDLDPAGGGVCDIWYLAYNDGLTGLMTGNNVTDLMGDFDLSNAISVTRNAPNAGLIALDGGATSVSICADGTPDPLTVVMSGTLLGDNSTFFITDAATGEILGVPGNNGPFDLDGAGEGVCDIWYLSAYGDVSGVSVGSNINAIDGCFALSNAITVTRNVGNDCDGAVDGGAISLATGGTEASICVDGIADPLEVTRDGNAVGDNRTFIITDAVTGEILAIPGSNGPFDLDPAGGGVCDIWYLAYNGDLTGLATGNNVADLMGDFDLSNAISITRNVTEAGTIALADGSDAATICVDGTGDPLEVVMSGETSGSNSTFVITDDAGMILAIPGNNGPFDLDPAGPGVCLIWYLAFEDGLSGAEVGMNANDLEGCFDLSNPITVTRNEAEAGAISLDGGTTEVSICADGTPDPLTVIMSGDVAGDNSTFFITDAATGEILAIPGNNGPFDLDGAGEGVCDIWYLSHYGELTGLATGNNINDIAGCFDLSNPIVVTRNVGDDCANGFTFSNVTINEVAPDGRIELFNGTDQAIDVSSFWLCNRPAYQLISAMTVECGELLIQPGDVTVISGFSGFDAADAELGLYTTNSFGSATALISYLEWGSAGHGRASVAVEAGLWMEDFFLTPPTGDESLQLTVNASNELEWVTKVVTLCDVNNATTSTRGETSQASVSIFPNPVNGDQLSLEVNGMIGADSRVEIYDFSGRRLVSQNLKAANGLSTVNLPEAPAGAYILRVVNNRQSATSRFTRF
ncbi:Por secretion system C-terminal sorting domain-containing protein [Neolewinella agarilytica]|uniref:Por secretion system C-terminal sorting domain-containing protein n=2 Tax=Neolewinella agarilytica TaxID=478744 RepID=A0A1H9KZ93_9BACT|nr:Por secretion system C-terminal sorting domain-containing protein [Neolewinella agarilytica]